MNGFLKYKELTEIFENLDFDNLESLNNKKTAKILKIYNYYLDELKEIYEVNILILINHLLVIISNY